MRTKIVFEVVRDVGDRDCGQRIVVADQAHGGLVGNDRTGGMEIDIGVHRQRIDQEYVETFAELIQVIEESWARPDLIAPYIIYVKMAYHLAEEARAGLSEFSIPSDFRDTLFDFQAAAVKIAARHLEKRGGVIIGAYGGLVNGNPLQQLDSFLSFAWDSDNHNSDFIYGARGIAQNYIDRLGLDFDLTPKKRKAKVAKRK